MPCVCASSTRLLYVLLEPGKTADCQMCGLEADARRVRCSSFSNLRDTGVVAAFDLHELEPRTLVGRSPHVGDRCHVPRVGQEKQAFGRHDDDRRSARKVGEVQNVRQRDHDERVELELDQALADRLQAAR